MTSNLHWIFDPILPSGSIQRGSPASHVFRGEIDTFIREVLQNSHDQKAGPEPVEVCFRFYTLEEEHRERYLRALGWLELEEHLEAFSGSTSNPTALSMKRALELIDDRPLRVLTVEDYGTKGLVGGEDEAGTNFNALCRNVLDTSDDKPNRGGSFGLGKAVLWRFSAYSTVLFSSTLPDGRNRFFARADLAYHETDTGKWHGAGWFGLREASAGAAEAYRAVSAWGDTAREVSDKLLIARDPQAGSGTSIAVVGFREPIEESERDLVDVAKSVSEAARRWFWPSLFHAGTLGVRVEVFRDTEMVYQEKVERGPEVEPFLSAMSGEVLPRAVRPGDVAEEVLEYNVPGRKDGSHGQFIAEALLRIARGPAEEEVEHRNTVALVRGAGMVVRYFEPGRKPLDDLPFYGVLLAGQAVPGASDADKLFEAYLRACEPPSHDQWETTDRVEAEYKQGTKARLSNLWKEIGQAIIEKCGQTAPSSGQGPIALVRLFPLGGAGGGSSERFTFRTDRLNAWIENDAWTWSGRIACHAEDPASWEFSIELLMDGETGKGARIPPATLVADPASVTVVAMSDRMKCLVPRDVQSVDFLGTSAPLANELKLAAGMARVSLDVRGRVQG